MWNFFVPFRRFLSTSPAQVLHIFRLVGGGNKGRLVVVKKCLKIFTLFTLYLKDSPSINVAYNDEPGFFEIVDNSMVEYTVAVIDGKYRSNIPFDFEILEEFFENKNINWINCNYQWGWYDEETGRWTGAVGKVKMTIFLLKLNSLI